MSETIGLFSAFPPILDYARTPAGATNVGYSVTGGVVYRGSRIPQLNGAYVFGDYGSGNIWTLRYDGSVTSNVPFARILGDAGVAAAVAAASPVVIPRIPGLTLIHAVSERQGDYESTLNVESLDAVGVLHLTTSADLPDPAGGKPKPVSFNRDVSSSDRDQARTYKYMFSTGAEEYPGTTAMGTSAAVIKDLRTGGGAAVTLDGEMGGLAAMLGGLLQMVPGANSNQASTPYLSAAGTIRAATATVSSTVKPRRLKNSPTSSSNSCHDMASSAPSRP